MNTIFDDLKSCPDCGSLDVEVLVSGWVKANKDLGAVSLDDLDDLRVAEMYSKTFYCKVCDSHPDNLESYSLRPSPPQAAEDPL